MEQGTRALGRVQRASRGPDVAAVQREETVSERLEPNEEQVALEACLAAPEVLLEFTSRCNFACTYCSSAFKERPKVDMPLELLRHLAPQLPGLTDKVIRMHVDGEPTLHPQFFEMAQTINRHGFRTVLATNGSRLDPAFLPLDMDVLISISTCPEEFLQRHRTMSFESYIERVQAYIRAWLDTPNQQQIFVQVPYTLGNQDDPEYARRKETELARMIEAIGLPPAEAPLTEAPYQYRKSTGFRLEFYRWDIVGYALYPVDGKRIDYPATPTGFCDSPWKRLAVLADGRVSCCCNDLSGGTAFTEPDEVWRTPLKEIWLAHPNLLAIRSAFLERRVPLAICRHCLGAYPDHEIRNRFV